MYRNVLDHLLMYLLSTLKKCIYVFLLLRRIVIWGGHTHAHTHTQYAGDRFPISWCQLVPPSQNTQGQLC